MKIIDRPIEIIAVFHPAELPMPYRFRFEDERGERTTVQINKVLGSRKDRTAGIDSLIFECQSVIGGAEKRYELKYVIARCEWQLYKM